MQWDQCGGVQRPRSVRMNNITKCSAHCSTLLTTHCTVAFMLLVTHIVANGDSVFTHHSWHTECRLFTLLITYLLTASNEAVKSSGPKLVTQNWSRRRPVGQELTNEKRHDALCWRKWKLELYDRVSTQGITWAVSHPVIWAVNTATLRRFTTSSSFYASQVMHINTCI